MICLVVSLHVSWSFVEGHWRVIFLMCVFANCTVKLKGLVQSASTNFETAVSWLHFFKYFSKSCKAPPPPALRSSPNLLLLARSTVSNPNNFNC